MISISEMMAGHSVRRSVPQPEFTKAFDVIVCGLGTAGTLAALFSAENGLSVLGIEAFTCVGGTHTAGGVPGHYFGCPGGRYETLEEEVKTFAQRYTSTTTESRILLAEQALLEHGAEIQYEASVCGVYLEGNTVIGLRVLTEGGVLDYRAKIVMDCTAEAYIATMAGCKTEMGREADGQMQPYSMVSLVHNGERFHHTNVDFGRVNQLNPTDLSQAILFSRSCPIKEGNMGKTLIAQMPLIGVREGRRILAEEMVYVEELLSDKQTQTPMFYSYADLDMHGWDHAFDGEKMGDWAVGANLIAYNVTVAVPYRAILPVGYEGLLVPCRALGVDRDISSCVRMNFDMKKVAEAAAEWATLAIKQQKTLREVSYPQLRKILVNSGCLKESDNRGYWIDGWKNWDGSPLARRAVCWITDPAELEDRLRTEMPGEAIWSARRMGVRALPVLKKLLYAEEENTQKHAAFALAMLGDAECQGVLRKMVAERDGLMLKDCRKNNNLRGWMAIYWLGRLGDRDSVSMLIDLICDEKEIEKEVYRSTLQATTRYEVLDFNNVYFQFMSQAVMALIRIGDMHADLRSRIMNAFVGAFADDAYYTRITQRPKESSEGNMVQCMKKIAMATAQKWKRGK